MGLFLNIQNTLDQSSVILFDFRIKNLKLRMSSSQPPIKRYRKEEKKASSSDDEWKEAADSNDGKGGNKSGKGGTRTRE